MSLMRSCARPEMRYVSGSLGGVGWERGRGAGLAASAPLLRLWAGPGWDVVSGERGEEKVLGLGEVGVELVRVDEEAGKEAVDRREDEVADGEGETLPCSFCFALDVSFSRPFATLGAFAGVVGDAIGDGGFSSGTESSFQAESQAESSWS